MGLNKEARPEDLFLWPGSLRMRVESHSKWRYFCQSETHYKNKKAKYMPQILLPKGREVDSEPFYLAPHTCS